MVTAEQTSYTDIFGNPIEVGQIYRNEVHKKSLSDYANLWLVEEMTPEWIQDRNLSHNSGSFRTSPETFNDRRICNYRPMQKNELKELLDRLKLVSDNVGNFLRSD